MKFPTLLLAMATLLAAGLLSSCSTASSGTTTANRNGTPRLSANHPAILTRNAQIATESRGDYYVGRRFWIKGTRFWGFVRQPGQPWHEAKLVVINESIKHTPDRLPEVNPGGNAHGYDHNYEYKLTGRYTGNRIYDPNSNQVLPEFQLTGYTLINPSPGFLFHPDQKFEKNRIPKPPY